MSSGVPVWSKPTEIRGYAESSSTGSVNDSSFFSSLHTPNVNFDLGDEWDDWDDFDEENLVHASEVPCTAKTLAVDCSKSKGRYSVAGYFQVMNYNSKRK